MKTNTLITVVVAVVAVAAGGFLMWDGDTRLSPTFQPPTGVSSSTSSSPLPSPAALPQSTQIEVSSDMREAPLEPEVNPISEKPSSSSAPTSPSLSPAELPQSTQIEVSSDMRGEPLEPEVNQISGKSSSSDLATQLSLVTQPPGPADVCVEMTKTMLCPIIGQMPFVRDWAGQFAIWGKTSCPMGDPAT